jgi:hypothetical protein
MFVSIMKPEIKYGLLTGAGVCAYILIEYLLGFHNEHVEIGKYSGYFSSVIPLVFLYIAIRHRRDKLQGGKLGFLEGMQSGFLVSAVAALIITLFMLVYNHYINPGWMELAMAREKEQMIREGYSQVAIETKLNEFRNSSSDSMLLLFGMPMIVGMGLIFSAVISMVLRKAAAADKAV